VLLPSALVFRFTFDMAATEKNQELIGLARDLKHTPWCNEYEEMISGMLYVHMNSAGVPEPMERG
jgi:hypothetical protein